METTSPNLSSKLWFAYFCTLLTWSVLAYALFADYIKQGEMFAHLDPQGRPHISDFVNVYSAAVLANECSKHKIDIYDANVQAEAAKKLTAPVIAEQPFYSQTPPTFFSLVRPLAFLNMTQAWIAWLILGMVLVFLGVYLLAFSDLVTPFQRAFVVVAVFGSYPAWLGFRLGQPALWLFAGLAAFWWSLLHRRSFLAGLAAGVATIKLQYLPIVCIVGLVVGRFKFFLGLASVSLALVLLSLVTVGWSNTVSYPKALLSSDVSRSVSGVSPELMQNFRGELVLLTGSDGQSVHLIVALLLAISIICGALLFWRRTGAVPVDQKGADPSRGTEGNKDSLWQSRPSPGNVVDNPEDFKIRASICTLLLLISSPHTHIQDYLAAAVAGIWLWTATKDSAASVSRKVLRASILAFPAISWLLFIFRIVFELLRVQAFFLWALVVIVCALILLRENMHPITGRVDGQQMDL